MPTVLVVDDQPTIRVLVRAALKDTGYRLLEAGDGVSAVQLARSERPDLILLDIALPRMDGLEVCRRLKEDPATAAIPVLLLSGLVMQQDPEQAAEAVGAEGCITKPFNPIALAKQITGMLRKKRAAVGST